MRTWSAAWTEAAYGPAGFWVSGPGARLGPRGHFRTAALTGSATCSVHAACLARLAEQVDRRLGSPAGFDLVDVGAGDGELLALVLDALPPELAARTRATAVEVRAAPVGLDARVAWTSAAAPFGIPAGVTGLVLAQEWLDEVPVDVVTAGSDGRRYLVLVADDGTERAGPPLDDVDACAALGVDALRTGAWLDRWWPLARGARAEVGTTRDDAWAALCARLSAGTAVAVDYAVTRDDVVAGRFASGSLLGHRDGATLPPVADGSVDLTAHVQVESCAAAVPGTTATSQRAALQALGASAVLPPHALAMADPGAYADSLDLASQAAELLDPHGLGGFTWLRLDR